MHFIRNFPRKYNSLFLCVASVFFAHLSFAQENLDSTLTGTSLKDIIKYALKNQPAIKQVILDEQITDKDIKIRLSDWLPQVNIENTYNDVLKKNVIGLPSTTGGGTNFISTGFFNSNTLGASATQTIYNNAVRIAAKSAKYYRVQAQQNTAQKKVEVVVNVSKAYYDLL